MGNLPTSPARVAGLASLLVPSTYDHGQPALAGFLEPGAVVVMNGDVRVLEPWVCPDWCSVDHSIVGLDVDADGASVGHCAVLWTGPAPSGAGDRDGGSGASTERLEVVSFETVVDGQRRVLPPSLGLRAGGSDEIPKTLTAGAARALADALIAGAEIVEASQTRTCGQCGAAFAPIDARTDCSSCQVAVNRERRQNLRAIK